VETERPDWVIIRLPQDQKERKTRKAEKVSRARGWEKGRYKSTAL
jgi:hypothetical protein